MVTAPDGNAIGELLEGLCGAFEVLVAGIGTVCNSGLKGVARLRGLLPVVGSAPMGGEIVHLLSLSLKWRSRASKVE